MPTEDDYAGSEIQKMLTKTISGRLHDFDLVKTNQMMKTLLNAMEQGLVESSHDLSEGGLGVALAETCFNTNLGLKLDLDLTKAQLFSETPGRFVVTVPKNKQAQFEKILAQDAALIGEVTADGCLEADLTDGHLQVDVLEAQKIWEEAIPCLMKSKD